MSQPDKSTGQFHSTKGTVVETVGNLTGTTSWQQSGKSTKRSYAEGTADRITGKKDTVIGAVTGDKSQQTKGNMKHNKGEAQQEINKKA